METISISGLDRVSAHELKGLFEVAGEKDQVRLDVGSSTRGQAGSLETVTAIIVAHGPEIVALLLTAWVAAKKSFEFEITHERADGEKKTLKVKYNQDGAVSVLKELKEFFSG